MQDVPEHEKITYTYSESHWCTESTCQELIELSGLALGLRRRGFLHWVLLWDCASVHRKASLLEWVRATHPGCHVLFVLGGHASEMQPADISIQQPLKHIIKRAGHTVLCRVCVSGRFGAGPAHWHDDASHGAVGDPRLQRGVTKRGTLQRRRGATSRGHSKRHHCMRRDALASTSTAHSSRKRQSWQKTSQESDLTLHDDDDETEDEAHEIHDVEDGFPRARAQLLERESCRSHGRCRSRTRRMLLVSALCVRPASTEGLIANCLRANAGPNVCLHRAVVAHVSRPLSSSPQTPRSWW